MNSNNCPTKTKVKTGCKTCKIRKVKCDEGRPACLRCTTTGRRCDGYGIWGGGSQRNQSDSSRAVLSLKSNIVPFKNLSQNESSSMDWFIHMTAQKLPGTFPSIFWTNILPQASIAAPAIHHAILTLSSVHKRQALRIDNSSALNSADTTENFTLQQYTLATSELRQQIGHKSRFSTRVALIACVVFIDLEYLRGYYTSALTHLRHGLLLLNEVATYNSKTTKYEENDTVDKWLAHKFTTLCLQSKLFGQDIFEPQFTKGSTRQIADEFGSLSDARHSLELTILRVLSLQECCEEYLGGLSNTPSGTTAFNLYNTYMTIKAELDKWIKTYGTASTNINRLTTPEIQKEKFAWKLLRVYHTLALAIITKCQYQYLQQKTTNPTTIHPPHNPTNSHPFPSSVINADTNTNTTTILTLHHQSIIDQTELLMHFVRTSPTHSTNNGKPQTRIDRDASEAIADIGWIPPLYYVAIHSDDLNLRLKAIDMLRLIPHREGIWDSLMAAVVAEVVLRTESEKGGEVGLRQGRRLVLDQYGNMMMKEGHSGSGVDSGRGFERCRAVSNVQVTLPKDPGAGLMLKLNLSVHGQDEVTGDVEDRILFELSPDLWSRGSR